MVVKEIIAEGLIVRGEKTMQRWMKKLIEYWIL